MPEKKHNKLPGYVAERSVIEGGGEVVLMDGTVAEIRGPSEHRWVIKHFPSNRVIFFTNQNAARSALNDLKNKRDEWNLLPDEVISECEIVDASVNVENFGGKNFHPPSGQRKPIGDQIEEIIPTATLIGIIKDCAENAVKCSKDGDVDYKTRGDFAFKLLTLQHGMPKTRDEKVQVNIQTTQEELEARREALEENIRTKPGWNDYFASVFSKPKKKEG